jgi:hypothetical protein
MTPTQVTWSKLAIAGLVLSPFCGFIGLGLSVAGYRECANSQGYVKGQGLAIAGIIISILGIIAGVILRASAH